MSELINEDDIVVSQENVVTVITEEPISDNNVTEMTLIANQGAKYLGFFSPLIPSKREKNILHSFAQFVYFLREVCLLFNF